MKLLGDYAYESMSVLCIVCGIGALLIAYVSNNDGAWLGYGLMGALLMAMGAMLLVCDDDSRS